MKNWLSTICIEKRVDLPMYFWGWVIRGPSVTEGLVKKIHILGWKTSSRTDLLFVGWPVIVIIYWMTKENFPITLPSQKYTNLACIYFTTIIGYCNKISTYSMCIYSPKESTLKNSSSGSYCFCPDCTCFIVWKFLDPYDLYLYCDGWWWWW